MLERRLPYLDVPKALKSILAWGFRGQSTSNHSKSTSLSLGHLLNVAQAWSLTSTFMDLLSAPSVSRVNAYCAMQVSVLGHGDASRWRQNELAEDLLAAQDESWNHETAELKAN